MLNRKNQYWSSKRSKISRKINFSDLLSDPVSQSKPRDFSGSIENGEKYMSLIFFSVDIIQILRHSKIKNIFIKQKQQKKKNSKKKIVPVPVPFYLCPRTPVPVPVVPATGTGMRRVGYGFEKKTVYPCPPYPSTRRTRARRTRRQTTSAKHV
jgi:hypothetical protein